MPYCAETDIEAEIKGLVLSTGSLPTLAQVTAFIDQESARMDSYITTRYALPITGTESLKALKRICIALVTWRVSDIISTRKQQSLPNGMISQDLSGATAYKQAIKDLESMAKGLLKLPDQATSNSSAGASYFASGNSDTSYEKIFEVDKKQW
jgi:phage gp36-like protein